VFCQGPKTKKKKSVGDTEEVNTNSFISYCNIKDQSILIILFAVSQWNMFSAKKVRSAETVDTPDIDNLLLTMSFSLCALLNRELRKVGQLLQ